MAESAPFRQRVDACVETVREHFMEARSIDPRAWDLAAAAGAASNDDDAIDVVRRQRALA